MSASAVSRPRVALNLVAAAVAVAVLAGCSYNVKPVENPVALPSGWDAPPTPNAVDAVQQEWWRSFNSPVLDGLIATALRDNPTLITTEERLKQAERSIARSREDLLPDLGITVSTQRSWIGGNQVPESTNDSTSVGLSTSYNFDIFGVSAAGYRRSLANFIGTKYDADLARITISANVARAYFNLLSVRSRVMIARENLTIAEGILRISEARNREGVLRAFDLSQQATQVLTQRTQLIPLENQLRAAETTLGLLLGVTPQDYRIEGEPIEQLTVPEIAPWAPSELLLRRPDMASAEMAMASARANMAAVRASFIPVTLSLSGSGNAGSQELFDLTDSRTYSVTALLRIAESIFSFRQRRTNVLDAESNEYIALVNYAQTIRAALKDVDDTLAAANANLRAEESQRATFAQAQVALRLAEIELREGSAFQQDVLDSQRALFSAQDSLAQARLQRLNTAVNLYEALGGGWAAPAQR